jgi:hypothetical protein
MMLHYSVHKRTLLDPISSDFNLVYTFTLYSNDIHVHFIITLPPTHKFPKWYFLLRFSDQNSEEIKLYGASLAQSVQLLATSWPIGRSGFDSQRGLGIFFDIMSRPVLGHPQPLIQLVRRIISLGLKLQKRAADHSPPSSAEVKKCVGLYLHSPTRLHGVVVS